MYLMDMPSMVRRMVMDPRVDVFDKFPVREDSSSQYVHGAVMRESPLFNLLNPQLRDGGMSSFLTASGSLFYY